MAFGGLLLVSVLLDDLSVRIRVPGVLMVLLLGLLIQGFALVPLAERMNLTLPSPQHDPGAAA